MYLFERGLAKSRTFAKELISASFVEIDGKTVTKPSFDVTDEMSVTVTGSPYDYVGRGGVKLEAALDSFRVDPRGCVCADIGASSGGFTDCLLRRGAVRVYAVDSGSGQLDSRLVNDPAVVNIENFNARYLTPDTLGEMCDIAVMDVSFISQTLILPAVKRILKPDGVYVGLVKPQFECGRGGLSKGGIVKDRKVLIESVKKVVTFANETGLFVTGLINSPVKGGDGNNEFLICCKTNATPCVTESDIVRICGECKLS